MIDLRKKIKECGGTISSVAEALGVSQPTLSQQISKGTMTLSRIEKIANILNVPLVKLVSDENEQSKDYKSILFHRMECPYCGGKLICSVLKEIPAEEYM